MNRLSTSLVLIGYFAVSILMPSCESKTSKEYPTDSTSTTISDSVSTRSIDNLKILFIETSIFKSKIPFTPNHRDQKRILLMFRVVRPGGVGLVLTLHGWQPSDELPANVKFNSLPTIELEVGGDAESNLKKDDYLGGLVIKRKTTNELASAANTKKYIAFIPKRGANGFIFYEIHSTDDNPLRDLSFPLVTTSIGEANPTPPRNYDEE